MALTRNYSQTLRAIGEALEGLDLESFDLEKNGKGYHVLAKRRAAKVSGLRALWLKIRGLYPLLELRFTPEDIDRLELKGQAKRRDPNGVADPFSLSQTLRVVGDYVDRKRGTLLRVRRRDQRLTIEYETAQGVRKVEEHTVGTFYSFWVHMYIKRSHRLRVSYRYP